MTEFFTPTRIILWWAIFWAFLNVVRLIWQDVHQHEHFKEDWCSSFEEE